MLLVLFIIFVAGCGKAKKTGAVLPEVRNSGTAVQWKYSDEADWRDLVALTELRGASGENGKDGADGKNGVDGRNGTNGKDGVNGTDGTNGENGKDGVNGINGIDGKSGIDGKDGKDGLDGINGTDGKNGLDGKDGKDGINGIDGADGKDGINGKDGIDGKDGVDGKDGINAKNIEVRRAESYIQWRYEGDEWQNLVAIADIEGPAGQNGTDGANGKTPEFRVSENILQWRYVGDEIWLNLYDLTALKGADGKDGADGINGKDGKTPFIGENGNWWFGEIDTGIKAAGTDGKDGINGINGTNGKEIEIQKTDLYIQWRYKGGEWQNLVALADILGPSGQNGTNGEDGRTPEFRVNGNQLQWRYAGETIWLNLYDLSALKGADGKDGSCAGYFAANGRVYSWGTPLPFNVKKESGDLISYNSSSKTITLSKGHTYSMVFSGTVMISANGTYKLCGASLIDGYNSSEMMLETRTYVSMIDDGQSARLGVSYNTIYRAEEDIALTFQYTNMLFQNTNFTDSQYNITIIALD